MVSSRSILLSPTPFLACLPALAQVVVIPRYLPVTSGTQVTLTAMVDGAPEPDPEVVWSFPGHEHLQAPGGKLTVPEVAQAMLIRVVATKDGRSGEGALFVQPQHKAAPAEAVEEPMTSKASKGSDRVANLWSRDLPFLDVGIGQRFVEPDKLVEVPPWSNPEAYSVLGYGLPGTVRWEPHFASATALLLTYRAGVNVERREVTGQTSALLTLRDLPHLCVVEGLWRQPGADGKLCWASQIQMLNPMVRGLVPFSGNAVAAPGHEDGTGLAARFQAPCGLLTLEDSWLVAADTQDQVLRLVAPDGTAFTLCGAPGEAGFADGAGAEVRFRGPTFLAYAVGVDKVNYLVADSGNHVLRLCEPDGRVVTYAGRPGVKGHKDAATLLEAEFNDPRGVVVAQDGCVYVADHGNGVIRRIGNDGKVDTLAGAAGQFGAVDGKGEAARFRALQGLDCSRGKLYVADGHALRSIDLETREVVTVCGQVDHPGFQDGALDGLKGKACLHDPCGVTVNAYSILVADRGNHAVRILDFDGERGDLSTLRTLAGAPAEDRTRWGLLRDGLPGPLPPDCGALEAPMAIAIGKDGAVVANGRSLACLSGYAATGAGLHPDPSLKLALAEGAQVRAGTPLVVAFGGRAPDAKGPGQADPWPLDLRLDFYDPATLEPVHPPIKGLHLHGNQPGQVKVAFHRPGPVEVRLRGVTASGFTYYDRKTLIVTAK